MANTKLEKLNLLDKFLFDETMEDKEAYQAAIGILLENEVELLEKPETEKEFRVSPQLWEVRLDVSLLEPGSKDFNLLNESCFILIAPFDVFGRGLYRCTFEGVCRECPDLKLEDGAVRIFINTKGRNREDFSREFLDFMEYIGKTTDETAERAAGNRIKKIHERVRSVRKSEKAGVKYMQRWEELAYAREDGDLQRVVSLVCKKIKKNKTLEEITDDLEEEVSVIEPIYNTAKEFAPVYDPALVFEQVRSQSR